MKRAGLHLFSAILALSSLPLHASTKIERSDTGRKGSAVVTPINDSIDDILLAAAHANAAAARSKTILALDSYPTTVTLTGIPAGPLASPGVVSPVAPIVVTGSSDSLLAYLPLAGLLAIPAFIGGGAGIGSGAASAGAGGGEPIASAPLEEASDPQIEPGTVPVSPIPEPATWLMLLIGFGAIGKTLRSARGRLRQVPLLAQP